MTTKGNYELAAIDVLGIENGKNIANSSVLKWDNISYRIDGATSKQILHSQSGIAYPRELLAIMGTSGAGKSTLLDVLAGRLEAIGLKGKISLNGSPIDKKVFRKSSGYVMQSDALFPMMTVKETIKYAAYLRISDKTIVEKEEIAENMIKLLRLDDCADTIIGNDENRGISGGQKRRVSIAVDIIHAPSVIFLDEPISGLDSTTSFTVIESLKELALTRNCTIIFSLHQPSARLFNLIDKVIFLESGRVTYNGPVSALSDVIKDTYKSEALGTMPIGNIPEVFLDMCDTLVKSEKIKALTSKYENFDNESIVTTESLQLNGEAIYANSIFNEIVTLMSRSIINFKRTPELFAARIGSATGFGILIGTLFLKTPDTLVGIQHRMSYFVFCIAFFYYTSLEALPIFLNEREIFQREYSRGAYRAVSYTIASFLVNLPFMLAIAVWFSCITYWLIGLPNLPQIFFFHVFTIFTILTAGSTFATLVSVLVPNPMTGQTAGSAILSIMFLFSGFFISSGDIPNYWIWLHYLSLFKYGFESLIINDLHDVSIPNVATHEQGITLLYYYACLFILLTHSLSVGYIYYE